MIHLRVTAIAPVFDGQREATIEIDRDLGTISVRPLRSRGVYSLTLAQVAEILVRHPRARKERRTAT